MVKAIIFDCFGVLTTDGWLPYKRRNFGKSGELFDQATELNHRVDAGLISYDDFVHGVADLAGVPYQDAKKQIEDNIPNAPLFELIRGLKPRYKIGFLSNAGGNWLSELFAEEQAALFDAVSISYETGHSKPAEGAYLDIARKLDVEPAECVFVDDQPRYCEAARDTGMQAIHYRNFEQFTTELASVLDRS
jgi:HAD superfamily hydrolase (TIGR01509 family)